MSQIVSDFLWEARARATQIPRKVRYDVPYVCQFARPEDVERIARNKLALADDCHWRLSGAVSPKEYALWSRAICGMACAAMVLDFYKKPAQKPLDLAKDAMTGGVYAYDDAGQIDDMRYHEFARWIRHYGMKAAVRSRLSLRGIQLALTKGIIMVSVSPNIRDNSHAYQGRKGGHLVVVTGYDLAEKVLFLNNPSGFMRNATQKQHKISEKEFMKYYAGRGIVLTDE